MAGSSACQTDPYIAGLERTVNKDLDQKTGSTTATWDDGKTVAGGQPAFFPEIVDS